MPDSETQTFVEATGTSRLHRLEAQFLKPYRGKIALATAGLLLQSILLLPVPLLQGWVLDHLVVLVARSSAISPADRATATKVIASALALTIALHLGRMVL